MQVLYRVDGKGIGRGSILRCLGLLCGDLRIGHGGCGWVEGEENYEIEECTQKM